MIGRRTFIAGVGSAAAWPVVARTQQGDRPRRIGILLPVDENDPVFKPVFSAFTQTLGDLGWADGATRGWTFVGPVLTSIGCERSRRSWSACNPTLS